MTSALATRHRSGDEALRCDGVVWTFADLDDAAEDLAAALALRQLGPGDRVGLHATTRLGTAAAVFALARRGIAVVALHPRLTAGEASALAERAGVRCVLDDDAVDALRAEGRGASRSTEATPSSGDAFALLFTSGTSGTPKAAVLSHGAFVASAAASAAHLGWTPADRWIAPLPLAHVGGLSMLTRCFLARRPVTLLPRFDVGATLAAVRDGGTLLSVVPTMLRALLEADDANVLSSLRVVLVGGAACPPDLLDACAARGVPAVATYGLTEMCSQVATEPVGAKVVGAPRGAGRALPGVELRVLRVDGTDCAPGEAGSIVVRGPMRMDGYLGHTPLASSSYFDTGDTGVLDEAGALRVLARRTDLVVTGGENVYPAEVEHCLEAHPAVQQAMVFGVPDAVWGQRVAALLVARGAVDDEPAWRASVLDHLHARLAGFKRPRLMARVASLPVLPSGKPDRAGAASSSASQLAPW